MLNCYLQIQVTQFCATLTRLPAHLLQMARRKDAPVPAGATKAINVNCDEDSSDSTLAEVLAKPVIYADEVAKIIYSVHEQRKLQAPPSDHALLDHRVTSISVNT